MKPARDLTNLEVLEIAIKAEIDAQALYQKMAKMVKNKDLKTKLVYLENEEKNHQRLFEDLYNKYFPETDIDIPEKSFVPSVEDALNRSDLSLKSLFEIAMQAEKLSEEFYTELSQKSTDVQSNKMFIYLAKIERGHYELLVNELEFLEQFPQYYQSEYFNFNDANFHVGP